MYDKPQFCREENGVHTCDKRRARSYIASHKPRFELEDGFAEEDRLWKEDVRETKSEVTKRAKAVLDIVFEGTERDEICESEYVGVWKQQNH